MDAPESPAAAGPLAQTEAEADRVTTAARERGITAALVGGLAIFLRCPSAHRPPLQRQYKDIDLVTSRAMAQRLTALLQEMGHEPDKRFNALQGGKRLFFWDARNQRQLDVFVDRFEMSHSFDLRGRLALDPAAPTLPLADLLLTKMQVVEINLKDMQDLAALLQDHPFTADETGINLEYITGLTRNDWGLQRTLEKTAEKLQAPGTRPSDTEGRVTLPQLRAAEPRYDLAQQLHALVKGMQDAPKSMGWKLRDKVGERKRWYELPEEARA
jgi:hypothetical protein